MSLHSKDWLKALAIAAATYFTGGAAAGLFGSGMFGSGAAAAGEGLAEGAAAGEGLASSGMFSQVPGVANGSQQAMMLAAQNEGLGGAASNMTAQAAMGPVNAARSAGQMSMMDFLGNRAKADMAGMNDPSVWMDRLGNNASRMAGNVGKSAATNMAMSALAPPPQTQTFPQPMQPHQGMQGPLPTPYGNQQQDAGIQQLISAAKSGDPAAIQKLKALMQQAGLGGANG